MTEREEQSEFIDSDEEAYSYSDTESSEEDDDDEDEEENVETRLEVSNSILPNLTLLFLSTLFPCLL